jgi:hypothetical protein
MFAYQRKAVVKGGLRKLHNEEKVGVLGRTGEMMNAYKILIGILEEIACIIILGGRVIIKWILNKFDGSI